MKIELYVKAPDDIDDWFIGCVQPPIDCLGYEQAAQLLEGYWGEWRDEMQLPEADYQFIGWLTKKYGWIKVEGNPKYTFQK